MRLLTELKRETLTQRQVIDLLQAVYLQETEQWAKAEALFQSVLLQLPHDYFVVLHLGNLYVSTGRPQQAILLLQERVDNHPNCVDTWYHLALAHDALDSNEQSEKAWNQWFKLGSDDPDAWCDYAHFKWERGDIEAAIFGCQEGLVRAPNHVLTLSSLIVLLEEEEAIHEALRVCRELLRFEPTDAWCLGRQASLFSAVNLSEAGESGFRIALAGDPANVDILLEWATWLSRQGRLNEAVQRCREAVRHEPTNAEAWLQLSKRLLEQQKVDASAEALHFALIWHVAAAEAWFYLGALQAKHNSEIAQCFFAIAAALDEDFALTDVVSAGSYAQSPSRDAAMIDNLLEYADLFVSSGYPLLATEIFRLVVGLDPKNAPAWLALGRRLACQHNHEEARTALAHCLSLDQGAIEADFELVSLPLVNSKVALARLREKVVTSDCLDSERWCSWALEFEKLEDFDSAVFAYLKAIDLAPNEILNWVLLGELYRKQGLQAEATAAFTTLPAMLLGEPAYGVCFGDYLLGWKQPNEALAVYQQLLHQHPNNALVWERYGDLLVRLEQGRQAEDAYRRSLDINPTNRELWYRVGMWLWQEGWSQKAEKALMCAAWGADVITKDDES